LPLPPSPDCFAAANPPPGRKPPELRSATHLECTTRPTTTLDTVVTRSSGTSGEPRDSPPSRNWWRSPGPARATNRARRSPPGDPRASRGESGRTRGDERLAPHPDLRRDRETSDPEENERVRFSPAGRDKAANAKASRGGESERENSDLRRKTAVRFPGRTPTMPTPALP